MLCVFYRWMKSHMDSRRITAITQLWSELLGTSDIWLETSVCVSTVAILWLAMRGEGVTDPVATILKVLQGLPAGKNGLNPSQ